MRLKQQLIKLSATKENNNTLDFLAQVEQILKDAAKNPEIKKRECTLYCPLCQYIKLIRWLEDESLTAETTPTEFYVNGEHNRGYHFLIKW